MFRSLSPTKMVFQWQDHELPIHNVTNVLLEQYQEILQQIGSHSVGESLQPPPFK